MSALIEAIVVFVRSVVVVEVVDVLLCCLAFNSDTHHLFFIQDFGGKWGHCCCVWKVFCCCCCKCFSLTIYLIPIFTTCFSFPKTFEWKTSLELAECARVRELTRTVNLNEKGEKWLRRGTSSSFSCIRGRFPEFVACQNQTRWTADNYDTQTKRLKKLAKEQTTTS